VSDELLEVIELTEYEPKRLPRLAIPDSIGDLLWRQYGSKIDIAFPSPKTNAQWVLISQGWVGHLPLTDSCRLVLNSKVELGNLFRMLEYAYHLKSFYFLEGLVECDSLKEFYERLANILARRVLDRARKGLYRAYVTEAAKLLYLRGRLDLAQTLRSPWETKLACRYEENTADIEDNQILAWTLRCIMRSHLCTERVSSTLRRAYRGLQGFVALRPVTAHDCMGRVYNRLNEDYEPLHALCRFFLEHSGPRHETGVDSTLPFLVNMARLYELFVAEWLNVHLPSHVALKAQERVSIGDNDGLHFNIDLVLYDLKLDHALCVLDTKYKTTRTPSADDVAQVVAYAEAKGCHEALLVYPTSEIEQLDERVGNIRVRSVSFSLDGDLETAGNEFLRGVLR